ncbi:MAG: hypothetical protein Q9204_002361 [Flavoplaca sp. TL-2023a]
MDEHFSPAPEAPLPPPQVPIIEPRRTEQRRSPERKKKPQKFYDDIKMVFDFHIPFTSHSRKKAKKPRKESRPADARDRPITPVYPAAPLKFGNPQPLVGAYPGPGMIPIPPPAPPRGPAAPTPPIIVHSISSTDSSPPLISPLREHHRHRARSLSLNRRYEERKEATRETERRKHVERVAFAENAKRLRAEREAQRLRDEVDRERRHKEDLRIRAQRLLDDQRRLQIEDADRQRRQSQERVAAAIVARRRRRELDRRREAEAEVEAQRRRRRREEERMQEERDRLTRQRRARIPRSPRHAAVVHHHHHHLHECENDDFQQRAREEFEGRGDWVLNEAIRAERSRPVGRGAPQDLQPRWPRDNGLRRRGTIAAGERRVYDDDFRRWGRRWF